MKNHTHKTNYLLKYSAIFLLGMSVLYFASAYTNINTSLTNATQYIQKIVLTSDGTQGGTTGIVLDGSNGDMTLAGNLTFRNDLDPLSLYQPIIKSLGEDLTVNGRYGLRLTAGSNFTSYINMSNSDGKGANPSIWFITKMTGDYLDERGEITFGQQYLDIEPLSKRYQISSYGEHHWYTGTGDDWEGIERMTIKDNGNVGIGVSNPTDNKLQIDGNITSHGFTSRGTGVIASGSESTAIGRYTNAYGDRSTAMGQSTFAKGEGSMAMGLMTTASGQTSTAMGFATNANGNISTTMGNGTIANSFGSTSLGWYNIGLDNSIFEIGIGDVDNHNNAMTVLNDGKVGIGTTGPSALLDVNGGIKPIKATSDPCADTSNYAEGTMFYNDNSNYYCFCDNTTTAKQMHSPATSCF